METNDIITYKDHIVSKRSVSNSTSANSNLSPKRDFASPFSNSHLSKSDLLPTIFEIDDNKLVKRYSSNSSITLKTSLPYTNTCNHQLNSCKLKNNQSQSPNTKLTNLIDRNNFKKVICSSNKKYSSNGSIGLLECNRDRTFDGISKFKNNFKMQEKMFDILTSNIQKRTVLKINKHKHCSVRTS